MRWTYSIISFVILCLIGLIVNTVKVTENYGKILEQDGHTALINQFLALPLGVLKNWASRNKRYGYSSLQISIKFTLSSMKK